MKDYIVRNLTKYDISDLISDNPQKSGNYGNSYSTGIYTIYGERIVEGENLKQGIYIINGKKVLIKQE